MLSAAIADLLPLAVGVALSPIPIIAVVLMLGTPKARSNGPAFAFGWILGLVLVSVVVLAVAGNTSDPDSGPSTVASALQLLLGLVFLVMAAKQWRSRPKPGEDATMPEWMASVDHFTARKSFGLGIALSAANPKNLVLTAAAAASIAQAGLSSTDSAIAIAVFVVLGSLSVVGLVLYYLVAGASAAERLATVKAFMAAHNAVIMMVVLLILGAKLLGTGMAGLLG